MTGGWLSVFSEGAVSLRSAVVNSADSRKAAGEMAQERRARRMTVVDLISVISLVLTAMSMGYVIGFHHGKTQK